MSEIMPAQQTGHAKRLRLGKSIPLSEIQNAFSGANGSYPPVMSLNEAAALAGLAPSTLKRKVSEGAFRASVRRGKPLRFWRDWFVHELMNTKGG